MSYVMVILLSIFTVSCASNQMQEKPQKTPAETGMFEAMSSRR